MNLPRHFRGMSICLVPHCFVSSLNILHLPTLHLPPSNPSFFVVFLLASGSRSFFSSFHVYYGHRRHRRFCSPSHVPCINILLSTCHTPHQASIRTHPSAIHTYLYSLPSRTYFAVPCLSHRLRLFNAENDGVLHRLVSIPTFVGSPGWTLHRSPSRQLSSSASDFGLSIPDTTLLGRIRITFPVCYISCIMCTCFWTYGTPYILCPFPLPSPSPSPPPPFSIIPPAHRHY